MGVVGLSTSVKTFSRGRSNSFRVGVRIAAARLSNRAGRATFTASGSNATSECNSTGLHHSLKLRVDNSFKSWREKSAASPGAKNGKDGIVGKFAVIYLLPMSTLPLFKWRHFQADIIRRYVRWYCRYALSYRDLEEMMQERGIDRWITLR